MESIDSDSISVESPDGLNTNVAPDMNLTHLNTKKLSIIILEFKLNLNQKKNHQKLKIWTTFPQEDLFSLSLPTMTIHHILSPISEDTQDIDKLSANVSNISEDSMKNGSIESNTDRTPIITISKFTSNLFLS